MTETVVVRLKSEFGGRLTARAKRLDGFTRKAGPAGEVLAELKAALARAKPRQSARKTQVRIYLVAGKGEGPIQMDFYSAIGEIVTNGLVFHIVNAGTGRPAPKCADQASGEPPFRAHLAADWPRNAAAAPLVLAAGGVGGGLAAAAGFAPFWAAAPAVAFVALLALSLIFAAVPRG